MKNIVMQHISIFSVLVLACAVCACDSNSDSLTVDEIRSDNLADDSFEERVDKEIDYVKAEELSNSIADDIVNGDREAIFGKLEKNGSINATNLSIVLDGSISMFGEPLRTELAATGIGRTAQADGISNARGFRYYYFTTKHQEDPINLTIQIESEDGRLVCSSISITKDIGSGS